MWRHRAQQRSTPVKREALIAGLASEGLALILGSAEAGRFDSCKNSQNRELKSTWI